MASITGTALYLAFGATVLDTDYRSFSPDESAGVVDESAGADTDKTYLTTLKDGTASATILLQAADTTTWGALVPGTSGTLTWAEQGTAAGLMKHTSLSIVTGRSKSIEYADVIVCDIEWQLSGGITDGTY